MDITLIGWFFIILSIYAVVKNKNMLTDLLIFSSVFTAAAVINIESTTTGIQPFYFVGTIWIISILLKYLRDGILINNFVKCFKEIKVVKALVLFVVIIILSELWLIIFNDKFKYIDMKTLELISVKFSKSNVTQPIFLIFMVIISILLCIELNTKDKLVRCIKIFAASTMFALIWGILQFCMYYLNIEYPSWIFNNNISFLQLFYQMIYGLKRVNSIALEPSTFALNIIIFLAIALTLWIGNYNRDNKKFQIILIIAIFLSFICGILTTSTTSLIGIVLIITILTIYVMFFSIKDGEMNKNKKKVILFYLFAFLSIFFVVILATEIFNMHWSTLVDALKDITINKSGLETGNERSNAIRTSLNIFKASPILGIGFGSFRSLDLTTNLLSNMGICGLASYFYIIYIVIKEIISNRIKDETISVCLGLTVIISSIALLIAIPDLIFGYYWIIVVVASLYFKN